MAVLAEQFMEARETASQPKSGKPFNHESQQQEDENTEPGKSGSKTEGQKPYTPLKARECFRCGKVGHVARTCPDKRVKSYNAVTQDPDVSKEWGETTEASGLICSQDRKMPLHKGIVCRKLVSVLRDSGCDGEEVHCI